MRPSAEAQVARYYRALHSAWGRQHWWPARTPLEVMVGAILTQNTAWTNVERAIANLRRARALSAAGLRRLPLAQLERLVRPSGYFRQKALRLKNLITWLDRRHGGSVGRMMSRPTAELRQELLELNGIGPETADSILLYAGHHPVFVVDAYTRRILERHQVIPADAPYDQIRNLFEGALGDGFDRASTASQRGKRRASLGLPGRGRPGLRDSAQAEHPPSPMSRARRSAVAQRFSDMHGLIVRTGKLHCHKRQPQCAGCPLEPFLPR